MSVTTRAQKKLNKIINITLQQTQIETHESKLRIVDRFISAEITDAYHDKI